MYLKDLRKMSDSDLMSIRDELRILKDVVYNLQSLDANMKQKRRGFAAGTRKELRKMFTFRQTSMDKVEQVLRERKHAAFLGKEKKKNDWWKVSYLATKGALHHGLKPNRYAQDVSKDEFPTKTAVRKGFAKRLKISHPETRVIKIIDIKETAGPWG